VPAALSIARSDVTAFDATVTDFTELLATVDVVLTKAGYSTFVEAACHGRPVLYVPRGNWAEEIYLIEWLHHNTRAQAIERNRLLHGNFMEEMESLLAQPAPPLAAPTGISHAVDLLAAALR
jgi:UDP-N-acetylglucosamine:LPS N-acetylglucosamine transferase